MRGDFSFEKKETEVGDLGKQMRDAQWDKGSVLGSEASEQNASIGRMHSVIIRILFLGEKQP